MKSRIAKFLLACAAMIAFACTTAQAKNVLAYQQINLVSDLSNTAQIVDTNLVNAWGIAFSTDTTISTNGLVTNNVILTNFVFFTNIVVKTKHHVPVTNILITSNIVKTLEVVITNNLVLSTNSLFWISANLTGKALAYSVTNDASSNPIVNQTGLEVSIPGVGSPTGVFPFSNGFFSNFFNADTFLFASEDGTISGWRADLGDAAEVFTNRATAVYKGIGIASTFSNGPVILAANFAEGTVDEYGYNTTNMVVTNVEVINLVPTNVVTTNLVFLPNLVLLGQFTDAKATNFGFAPFSIQVFENEVFVLFAKQDAQKIYDVPGAGNGIVDIFTQDSGKFTRFITGKGAGGKDLNLNSPWAFAVSPPNWGNDSNKILISNFGNGTIAVYSEYGKFQNLLQSNLGGNVVIPGLWGLTFGNNGIGAGNPDTLFFTAGGTNEMHGVFGTLVQVLMPKKK